MRPRPIGSALGYLVGGAIESAHGWRAAFFVAGGPGLLVALLCLLIVEPPRPVPTPRPSRRRSGKKSRPTGSTRTGTRPTWLPCVQAAPA